MIKIGKSEIERYWIAWNETIIHYGRVPINYVVSSGMPNFYKTVQKDQFDNKLIELGFNLSNIDLDRI